MHILVGHTYQYRPFGLTCTVTEVSGERHRARITLVDGRDVQEVPFHDLDTPLDVAPAPAPAPPLDPDLAEPVVEDPPKTYHPAVDPVEEYPRGGRDNRRGRA